MLNYILVALIGGVGGFIIKNIMYTDPYKHEISELKRELLSMTKDNGKLKDRLQRLQQEMEDKALELKSLRNKMYAREDDAEDKKSD